MTLSREMSPRRFVWPALLAAVIFAAGCTSLAGFKKPGLQVVETRLAALERDSAQLTVTLKVTNPNPSEISLTDLKAKLFVADTEVGEASSAQPRITLAANSTVMVPLRVDLPFKSLSGAIQRSLLALAQGSLPYRLTGTVTTNNGLLTMPFDASGEIASRR